MVIHSAVNLRVPSLVLAASLLLGPGLDAAQPAPAADADPSVAGTPLSELARGRIEAPAEVRWVGELFPLTLRVSVARRAYASVAGDFEWAPDDLIFEEWSTPQATQAGERVDVTRTARGYLKTTGTLRLPDTRHGVTLVTGYAGDRSALTDRFVVPVTGPVVRLRRLPTPAPAAFAGAVGDFVLESRLSKTEVNVGDSVTWTVQLRGTGNWPEVTRLPVRTVPKEVTATAPILKREFAEGAVFEGSLTEEVLLVPNRAGAFSLGPVRFVFFDPKEGKYQLYTTETFTLTVGEGASPGEQPAKTPDGRTLVPAVPPLLPLDPETSPALGRVPLSAGVLPATIGIAVVGLLACWLGFARDRSLRTDPLRERRRARADLQAILLELKKSGHAPDTLRGLLFAWQRNVAELAGIATAMPGAETIARALEGDAHRATGSSWIALWQEANRAIYGAATSLPYDWEMRASAALSDVVVPAVPVAATFRRGNLLPYAAALVLAAALLPPPLEAAPLDDYNRGDFAAAETGWRALSAQRPLDAHLRYNLALAASQQNRWPESVAHSLAALTLAPRDPSIRWQFALSLERSGVENPAFTGFAGNSLRHRLARQLSPREWTLAGSVAALAAAAAAGALLAAWYRGQRWPRRLTLAAVTGVLGAFVVAAGISLGCWGPLAEPATVVVARNTLLCSVPTEIDVAQKTVPLPAGSLAQIDRAFLGWSRLVFPNRQTGWVRTDALVSLYR